jgi:hypothetical protein
MSFSDFKTIDQVQRQYNVALQQQSIIQAQPMSPSPAFAENLQFDIQNIDVRDEAARREVIIYPLLREIFRRYADNLSLFSHRPLAIDDAVENNILSGVPDYLVSSRSPLGRTVMGKPLLIVVEAKRDDFSLGWAQCLAEMIAAQKYNESDKISVYGIVTNGDAWEFGKLTQKLLAQFGLQGARETGIFR